MLEMLKKLEILILIPTFYEIVILLSTTVSKSNGFFGVQGGLKKCIDRKATYY